MAKIPRVIKWRFDPDKSEVEALRNPQDRILWSVLRSGHIVDQHFNGTMGEFGRYVRQYPPADAQVLAELAHRRFGLHGYGVAPYARMPFEADLEWWGELLEAWRGNISILGSGQAIRLARSNTYRIHKGRGVRDVRSVPFGARCAA